MKLQTQVSLKPYNTFGIDAVADYLVEVHTVEEIREVLANERLKALPRLILGGGSNVLLAGDYHGLVILNRLKGIERLHEDPYHVWIKASGGEVWHQVVLYAIANNLAGIENLSLIPGSVGAAPMQNIGAYGVELVSVFDSLEALNLQTGEVEVFDAEACQFGYRESVFKTSLRGQYFILSVTLRLNKSPKFQVNYGDIKQTLADMRVYELSIKAVSDAVIKIRQSKLPDPNELGNAGSFFKNPEIPQAQYDELQEKYPLMPSYPTQPGMVKVPAGWLIEQCGWKGKRVGNTGSHARQALVLVNYGNATGHEVWALAQHIKQSVKDKFDIDINPEVNVV